jgi:anthranilate synthase component 1
VIEHTFVADALTPVAAYAALRKAAPDRPSFLLESVVGGERWGRYSILGYRPDHELRLGAAGWERIGADGTRTPVDIPLGKSKDPLAVLSHRLGFGKTTSGIHRAAVAAAAAREQTSFDRNDGKDGHPGLKLASAYVGVFAWDLVHAIDRVPDFASPRTLPMARLVTGGPVVVFDSLAQTVTVAAETDDEVQRALAALAHPPPLPKLSVPERGRLPRQIEVDVDDATFRERVEAAQEHIRAGDAFQIVLSRSFSVARDGRDPFDVYRAMRLINPSPYMYFFDFPASGDAGSGDEPALQIAGASPETLVRKEGTTVTIRPLAGTRPRGLTAEEDLALEKELLADPKERAEHVMLIDLGRNDVGRVASIGTVKLRRQMEIERYSHVMHIVSEVEGQVPDTTSPLEVLRAAFPAGTLSGAPKLRAMQIIRELEGRPRGVYGGAVGYVAENGDLDLAIAIRTAVFRGERIEVTAGAGIVDASDPKSEADETRNKARAVLCAIEAAPSERSEKV